MDVCGVPWETFWNCIGTVVRLDYCDYVAKVLNQYENMYMQQLYDIGLSQKLLFFHRQIVDAHFLFYYFSYFIELCMIQ